MREIIQSGKLFEEKCNRRGVEKMQVCGVGKVEIERVGRRFKMKFYLMIQKATKKVEYTENERKELTRSVCTKVNKKKISWEIDESIEQEERDRRSSNKKTMGAEPREKKKRRIHRREEGGRRIVTRGGGLVWMLPKLAPEEITWRRKRRRELLERWEAPPLGPPKETP